ncbi:hypothetical protein QUF50_01230 [Thiotrichales bacterium HSG1]|nr:hypothetical protein [Thiotrichales bacterium HSG1]
MSTYFRNIFIFIVLLSGCATPQLNYTNFSKVVKGMTEQEVIKILGEPTKVTGGSVDTGTIGTLLGFDNLSGTTMTWTTDEAKANVIFLKDKVKTKSYSNQF